MNKRQKKKLRKKLDQKNQSLKDFKQTIKISDYAGRTMTVVLEDTLICSNSNKSHNTNYVAIAKLLKSQRFRGNRRKRILLRRRK